MTVAKIAHHPEMTWEQAMEVFKKEFGDRYKVYSIKGTLVRPRHFAMRKSGLRGVSLRLVQTKDETKLIYTNFIPSVWVQLVVPPFVPYIPRARLNKEIKAFIERAPEFH